MGAVRVFFISLGIFSILIVITLFYTISRTQSASPKGQATYTEGDVDIRVLYSRPFKKGRNIFGSTGLVPFQKVWRTGANKATLFTTNKPLRFGEKILQPGRYSLWTIPGEHTWKIIFNTETTSWFLGVPMWGVDRHSNANKDDQKDVLVIEEPVVLQDKILEQFTISIKEVGDEIELVLFWDKTLVATRFTIVK